MTLVETDTNTSKNVPPYLVVKICSFKVVISGKYKNLGPTKDRKGHMPPKRTEKNFWAPKRTSICYFYAIFNTYLRTFNIIVVLISDCIIVFALKCLIKISQLFLSGQSNKDMTIGNIIIILQILTLSPNQFRNKFCNSHFLESAVDVSINYRSAAPKRTQTFAIEKRFQVPKRTSLLANFGFHCMFLKITLIN